MLHEKNYLSLLDIQTPYNLAKKMLRAADITPNKDVVYDIGCGDGEIPRIAVQTPFYAKKAVGIEIDPELCFDAIREVNRELLRDRVEIINKDVFECDLSEADVVCLNFLTSRNEKLKPKLERELKPSARVVCHDFPIMGWKHSIVKRIPFNDVFERGNNAFNYKGRIELGHFIYLYEIADIHQKQI